MALRDVAEAETIALADVCPTCGAPIGQYCDPNWFPAIYNDRAQAMRAGHDLRRISNINGIALGGTLHWERLMPHLSGS